MNVRDGLRLIVCAVVGYTGGLVSSGLIHAGSAVMSTLAGVAFGLLFWKRRVGLGDGLMWGGAFGIAVWLVSFLGSAHAGISAFVSDIVCLGIPLGFTLGIYDRIAFHRNGATLAWSRALLGGGFAGVAGGWAFGKWMEQAHFFPLIAGIFNSTSRTLGVTLHFTIAITIGATFGLLFQREIRGLGSSLAFGAAYGLLWWCVGPLTLLPILSHHSIDWSAAAVASLYGSLIGHVIYGLIVGLLYAVIDVVWLRLFYQSDPLNREPEGVALRTVSSTSYGLLASIVGGLCFALVMIGSGTLSSVAAIVGSTSLWIGFAVHMTIGIIIGTTYGLLFRYESRDATIAVAWGLVYGLLWWFVGALTLFPLLLGKPFVWTLEAATGHFPSLVGHLLYGALTALCFVLLEQRHRRKRESDPRIAARERRRERPQETAAPASWLVTLSLGIVVPVLLAS